MDITLKQTMRAITKIGSAFALAALAACATTSPAPKKKATLQELQSISAASVSRAQKEQDAQIEQARFNGARAIAQRQIEFAEATLRDPNASPQQRTMAERIKVLGTTKLFVNYERAPEVWSESDPLLEKGWVYSQFLGYDETSSDPESAILAAVFGPPEGITQPVRGGQSETTDVVAAVNYFGSWSQPLPLPEASLQAWETIAMPAPTFVPAAAPVLALAPGAETTIVTETSIASVETAAPLQENVEPTTVSISVETLVASVPVLETPVSDTPVIIASANTANDNATDSAVAYVPNWQYYESTNETLISGPAVALPSLSVSGADLDREGESSDQRIAANKNTPSTVDSFPEPYVLPTLANDLKVGTSVTPVSTPTERSTTEIVAVVSDQTDATSTATDMPAAIVLNHRISRPITPAIAANAPTVIATAKPPKAPTQKITPTSSAASGPPHKKPEVWSGWDDQPVAPKKPERMSALTKQKLGVSAAAIAVGLWAAKKAPEFILSAGVSFLVKSAFVAAGIAACTPVVAAVGSAMVAGALMGVYRARKKNNSFNKHWVLKAAARGAGIGLLGGALGVAASHLFDAADWGAIGRSAASHFDKLKLFGTAAHHATASAHHAAASAVPDMHAASAASQSASGVAQHAATVSEVHAAAPSAETIAQQVVQASPYDVHSMLSADQLKHLSPKLQALAASHNIHDLMSFYQGAAGELLNYKDPETSMKLLKAGMDIANEHQVSMLDPVRKMMERDWAFDVNLFRHTHG